MHIIDAESDRVVVVETWDFTGCPFLGPGGIYTREINVTGRTELRVYGAANTSDSDGGGGDG